MADGKKQDLYTAGKLALALEASPGLVKKAIEELKLKPAVIKSGCSYYDSEALGKIKAKLAK
jgi:hypothetical protein